MIIMTFGVKDAWISSIGQRALRQMKGKQPIIDNMSFFLLDHRRMAFAF